MSTTVSSIHLCLDCSSTIVGCGTWIIAVKAFEAGFATIEFLFGHAHLPPTVVCGADGRQRYIEKMSILQF